MSWQEIRKHTSQGHVLEFDADIHGSFSIECTQCGEAVVKFEKPNSIEVLEEIERSGVVFDELKLGDLVHDHMSREASNTNNSGTDIEYLVDECQYTLRDLIKDCS